MKKIILSAIAMVLLALPMYAQKIDSDKTDPNGVRSISTSSKMIVVFGKGGIYYSLLNVIQPEGDEQYYISTILPSTNDFNIPKDGLLLIKTGSNKVIECKQILEEHESSDPIGTYDRTVKVITHHISGMFKVSLEDLKSIASDGIIKVRIDTSNGYRDWDYKKKNQEKSKEYFNESLANIEEAKKKSSDIREGF